MKISCVVPVYNNSSTIRHVLSVLNGNERIDELVVIDDGSKDDSVRIVEEYIQGKEKIVFLKNERNLGKGGAVVRALKRTSYGDVFLCDADLSKLNQGHVDELLDTYFSGKYDMVIGSTDNPFESKNPLNKFLATVSGERILKKSVIEPFYELISKMGNGIEQITNYAHQEKEVKIINLVGTGHVLKYQRNIGKQEWIRAYVKEGGQLLNTDVRLKRQIVKKEISREKLLSGVAVGSLVAALLSFWFFSTRHNRKERNR